MIIGVDAGMLAVTDERLKVGVWRVAVNLLRELAKLDRSIQYRLYSFTPITNDLLQLFGPQMENRVLTPSAGWFSLRVPLELRLHPVDVFLGLGQALPPGKQKNIGFIYDVGFLYHPQAYPDAYARLARQTEQLAGRADQVVAISRSVKKDVMKFYAVPAQHITVAYPGVDSRFKPIGRRYIGKHPYFLFVGALKRGKNIPVLLEAFALFLKKNKKIYDLLLVGGDYWLDPEIEKTIKRLGIGERVQLVGFISDREIPAYYRGALAYVAPSLVEGFCLPAVEAMACDCPVIVSDIPVMREIAGRAALFTSSYNKKSLAAALEQIVNEKVRQRLVALGLAQATKFSWKIFAREVFSYINI